MNRSPSRVCRAALALVLAASCRKPADGAPEAGRGAGGRAADSTALRRTVDAAVRPVMTEYDVPGVAVAVTVDGLVSFFNYGVASRESGTPVSEATLFEIGSDSKTFTATLALYAQALGKLSLDDHPSRYLPQLAGRPIDSATLIELGTYTAGGLPLQFPNAVGTDDATMLAYFRQWKPDAAPGTLRRYSNPSIGLFGHLAALALRTDFADAMETRIFPGLGLTHSYIRVPPAAMAAYAWGYAKENRPIRVGAGPFDAEAYGVKSTSADLIHFVQLNIDPSTLEEPLRRAVLGTHVGYFQAGEMVQGLGWEQYPYPVTLERLQAGNSSRMGQEPNPATRLVPARATSAPTLFNKTGSTNGFGAYIAFVPARRIGLVMLANRNLPIPARISAAHAILSSLTAGSSP